MGRRIFKVFAIITYLITFILLILAIVTRGDILITYDRFEPILNVNIVLPLILTIPSLLIAQYIIYGSINPLYILKKYPKFNKKEKNA